MLRLHNLLCFISCCVLISGSAFAKPRVWKSAVGPYSVKAEAIAFGDDLVVLRKPDDSLVAVELSALCEEDQAYVKSKNVQDEVRKAASEMQTWTSRDGMKVNGRVVAFGRKTVKIGRQRGSVIIDEKPFSKLDALHQRVLLKVLSKLEKEDFENEKQLNEWAKSLRAQTKEHKLEGVLLQLESGDEIGVPFFMFSEEDLKVLEPGWESWLQLNESEEAQREESFLLQAQAIAYQKDRAANRQIELLKLELLGAATGVTNIWQVGLVPARGRYGRPMIVVVSAPNSRAATAKAMARYSGYVVGGVRKASY